jgi:rubrerythrin
MTIAESLMPAIILAFLVPFAFYCAEQSSFWIIGKWRQHTYAKRDERLLKEYRSEILSKYKDGQICMWCGTNNIRKEWGERCSKCGAKFEL